MNKKLEELKTRLMEIGDLNGAGGVLAWDQSTYMPQGGGPARGRQMATLAMLAQEKQVDPAIGKLLDDLRSYEESLPFEDDDASLIRVARRDYERSTRLPPEFVARLNAHSSETYMLWAEARPANDFKKVLPNLEKTLDLSREMANYFPGYEHIADPLIDFADYGMKAASVRKLFADLRAAQVPIVQAITSQAPADDSCLRKHFPDAEQMAFCEEVVRAIGYDFQRGRIDKTHHPFTAGFSVGDVRITTRVREDYLGECLFSNIHEAGHALYEQGVDAKYDGLPLQGGTSAGVHESQSRLWENIVGRSRGFWEFFYPKLQKAFPDQLKGVSLEAFYRAINKVERSLIRTDADEVTYNLHVMLRFEFELAMLEGSLAVRDLPEAWRERFKADLGIVPPDDKDGCMQDVHWFGGVIGGVFQGYTLGNVIGAQFYATALKAHPGIPGEIRQGKFEALHGWLIENVYRHGRKFTAPELVQRVTSSDVTIEPYIQYLRTKYGELYKL
ncbi:MAG TPA: carboxypeptidase M32 [Anaerolineales bacterium]|nr:carboxypeptidase M32 [Anaerolineales bacterium]